MPTTLTLKNIPDDVYERLKAEAGANRRSLNGQAIVLLESALKRAHVDVHARLARARALRSAVAGVRFRPGDIDTLKRRGRR
jgi:plasmid stability protein